MPLIPSLTLLPQVDEVLAILQQSLHQYPCLYVALQRKWNCGNMCEKPKLWHANGIPTLDNTQDEWMTAILINCYLSSAATLRVFVKLSVVYFVLHTVF